MNTSLQRSRTRHIRNTWNISTVKGYITQNYIKLYDTIQHMSSPLFSIIRPPTRTIWHASRIIDITQQPTDHLHRWKIITLSLPKKYRVWQIQHPFGISSPTSWNPYGRNIDNITRHIYLFMHDIYLKYIEFIQIVFFFLWSLTKCSQLECYQGLLTPSFNLIKFD
jgi:hypothetical protein